MNLQTALGQAIIKLKKSSSPALDAEVLLAHVLKKDRTYLYANPTQELTHLQTTTYELLTRKRCNHWPVAYLTGHKEFFGLDFLVTPDVLIPRPETELLVELALQATSYYLPATVVDLGTGSGNIIVSVAKSLFTSSSPPLARGGSGRGRRLDLKFFATDSSAKALKIARHNARRHGVADKIKFLRGNLLSPFLQATSYKLQPTLIIANLPYLTPAQYHANPDLWHEPKSALVGGPDGLRYFHKLFMQIQLLTPSPGVGRVAEGRERSPLILLLEHDQGQKSELQQLISPNFPKAKIKFFRDLAGHYRFCSFSAKGGSLPRRQAGASGGKI